MRNPTFNKLVETALCITCKINPVPLSNALRPCDSCRKKKAKTKAQTTLRMGQREPSAIIETDNGTKVFVDKTGKEVSNPGYDLTNDPRGHRFTGTVGRERKRI